MWMGIRKGIEMGTGWDGTGIGCGNGMGTGYGDGMGRDIETGLGILRRDSGWALAGREQDYT